MRYQTTDDAKQAVADKLEELATTVDPEYGTTDVYQWAECWARKKLIRRGDPVNFAEMHCPDYGATAVAMLWRDLPARLYVEQCELTDKVFAETLGSSIERTLDGRPFRPEDRYATTGHVEVIRDRPLKGHNATGGAPKGVRLPVEDTVEAYQTHDGRDWQRPTVDDVAYGTRNDTALLERMIKRMTGSNAKRHGINADAKQCRSARMIASALIASNQRIGRAAKQLGIDRDSVSRSLPLVHELLRMAYAISERVDDDAAREFGDDFPHERTRCRQLPPVCLPLVADNLPAPTSEATGGPHERYPAPAAKRWADKQPTPLAAEPVTRDTVGQILARQATIRAAYDRHVTTR